MAHSSYSVERSTTIDAPSERIYEQVADFRNWTKWSPWEDIDPELQRTYSGSTTGQGSVYQWSGNRKAGQGRMTITEAIKPSLIRIDLVFEKPWKARNDTVIAILPAGAGSRVVWTLTGEKTFMVMVMGIFKSMDKLVGPDFEKGLARLKVLAENKQ